MRRRAIIALLGFAAIFGAAAQAPPPVIGFLSSRSSAESAALVSAFREGLRESGYVDGQNVRIEFRWADGDYARLASLASDLVSKRATLLVPVGGEVAALAAKSAAADIPVVFVIGSDPVEAGLVAMLGRPGGNVTGATLMAGALGAKRLELLRELVPTSQVIGFLLNPEHPRAEADLREARDAADAVQQDLRVITARTEHDLDNAFASMAGDRIGALIVNRDGFLNSRRERIIGLAARHSVPAIYESREHAVAGGLMSYGTSYSETYRQAGIYAGRVLKGARPADLPVVQPTKFELVVNRHTARELGLSLPPTLLARADEVVE